MSKQYLRVVKWDEYQHYKDRNPPWIKMHNSLLEDPALAALPDATKAHLFGIWLLASRLENKIPADPAFIAKRINATSKVNLKSLMLMGFLELHPECLQDASNPLALCTTEERRGETEESRDRDRTARRKKSEEVFDSTANRAPIDLYNSIFGTDCGYTPGNLRASDRALRLGYTIDQMRTAFEAVKGRSTSFAAWCAKKNLEFGYLMRPEYVNRKSGELQEGPINKILNEIATGRKEEAS